MHHISIKNFWLSRRSVALALILEKRSQNYLVISFENRVLCFATAPLLFMLIAILPMYIPMVLVIGIHFMMLLVGKTRYPRWMLAFHPVTWNILLVVIPDIAQAMQVPVATWMSVMSQSSTNSSIVIWCIAAAIYEKKYMQKEPILTA